MEDGRRITSIVAADGASNPLLKTVVLSPGAWLDNFDKHEWLWAVPVGALVSALLTIQLLRLRLNEMALFTSGITQATTILTAGVGLFPFLMPSSSNPGESLPVWDASSSAKTLLIMLIAGHGAGGRRQRLSGARARSRCLCRLRPMPGLLPRLAMFK
jgi:cytochrome bd ubiquinol oxidase subunit II